ncbi:Inner membrane transport protein YdhP [Anatilimnocola aggregata]|uniref:Inner membrane transport protein YdhP n=1 Tax=Anatilimnocola aggregata TaxID=2528021 RepID=A0A517Y6U0_9BACT|nr:MFS transporter [Anatilimnocola aggregata]QDU25949.1 Inner membrane transport protein YdhP [Anatilimnocola aggregata]
MSNPYESPVLPQGEINEPFALAQVEARTRTMEWVVLLVLASVQFTSIVDFVVVMPLGPQLMRAFKIGPAEFGLIVSSYTFAAGIAGLVASSIIDRFSRRTAFLSIFAGFLLGTLLCAVAPTYWLLVAARILTGAFGGILGGMAMAIVGDVFPENRRGAATGFLMSGFAVASVVGVPFGLYLGTNYGWHMPFVALVALGLPVLVIATFALPPLNAHLGKKHTHPLRSLVNTFSEPNHLIAFALSAALMIGGFAVIPYISPYLVANVGMRESQLPFVYVAGGLLTLFVAPVVGKLADWYGKLTMFLIIAPLSAVLLIAVTFLPPVPTLFAVLVVGCLMVSNAGRMIAAMAMITGSVRPELRGGFMSANASMQHIASGIGAYLAGLIITQAPDGKLEHFGTVGIVACGITLLSLIAAVRLRKVGETEEVLVAVPEHG